MTRAILLIALACLPIFVFAEDGFVPMFNGKDLSGWVPCNVASGTDGKDTFTIKDNVVYCTGKPTGVMRTERMYENFIVEFEWRHMVPKGNSGFFLWADDITSRGVPFSRGIEVQILDGPNHPQRNYTTHGDLFPIHGATAKPDHPGKFGMRSYPTEDRSKPSPEWNHYRVEAVNGTVTLSVNGKVVNRTTECSPRKGYLCLESEGGVVEFRNLRIKELPPSENLDPKHVAIADRGFKSIYTGVDLSGWTATKPGAIAWQPRDWTLRFTGPVDDKKLPPDAYVLRSRATFTDFEFLFDVKQAKPEPIVVLLGDRRVTITPPPLAAAAAKPGWRRIIVQSRGAALTAAVDGVGVDPKVDGNAAAGEQSIGLAPTSATDYANLYVRPL